MKKFIFCCYFFSFVSNTIFCQQEISNIFGFATSNTFTYCDLNDTNFFNKVIRLNPKLLRFPGGAVGNYYHFGGPGYGFDFEEIKKYDAGKFLKRSKGLVRSAQKKGHKHDYIDDFIKLANATNAKVILVVNMFSYTDDILHMIRKMKDNNIEISGVELGSELTNRYFFQKGYTIDDYIKSCLYYTKKIKDFDSSIKIGIVAAPLGKKKNHRHNIWNNKLSKLDFYDAVIVHSYPKIIKGTAEYGQMTNEIIEEQSKDNQFKLYANRLINFFKYLFPKEIKSYYEIFNNKPIWITEWNLQMSKVTGNTMLQALFVVNYLLETVANNNQITLTTYHNLGGRDYSGSIFKNYKETVEIHSTYYPFKIISEIFSYKNVSATVKELKSGLFEYKVSENNILKNIIILNYNNENYLISMNNKNVNISSIFSEKLYDKPLIDGKLNTKILKDYSSDLDIVPFSINFIEL